MNVAVSFMTLRLDAAARAAIAAHALAVYPNECVGLLIGEFAADGSRVLQVLPLENRWSGQVTLSASDDAASQRDRFYLDPRDYLRAERAAQAADRDVVGCYHSHPDWPAEPSERDRIGAQAIAGDGFAFVIQSVSAGYAGELRNWHLVDEGARFVPAPLHEDDGA
jgi:proteasome lid subunit RPN8/RPN11